MTDSEAVRRANEGFYRAFESLDRARMEAVWLGSARIQCTHPGWRRLTGWSAIMESWQRIFDGTIGVRIELSAVEVVVCGEVGWVVCTENLTTDTLDGRTLARVEATNLFERHAGEWRLVHHHGSPVIAGPGSDEPTAALH